MHTKQLPRVLYVIDLNPELKFGSLEEQMICLALAFQKQGGIFCPLFICGRGSTRRTAFEDAEIVTESLDLGTFHWTTIARLSQLVTNHGITLVHWNFTEPLRNSYLWWLTLLHPNVRHCYTDHISRVSLATRSAKAPVTVFKNMLLRRYDKVFCVSQFVLDDLKRQHVRPELILLRHFINTDRFCPNQALRSQFREQLNVKDRFVLLTVAQLIKPKGIDVLIRALAELPKEVNLWIVGDGTQSGELRRLCADLQLTSRVWFHGLQKNVEPFMQAADCFVCPSVWAEAAGLVNLEANASGLPVIASNIGGLPEYVEDGRTGLLFTPGDHRQLASCVRSLLTDYARRQQMSAEARIRAVDRFNAETGVLGYLNAYRA